MGAEVSQKRNSPPMDLVSESSESNNPEEQVSASKSIYAGNRAIYHSASGFAGKLSVPFQFPDPKTLNTVEASKRLAARRAVEEHFPGNLHVVGIGSGSTVVYVVERIVELGASVTDRIIFIPTGFQSRELLTGSGLNTGSIDLFPRIDLVFDGTDEADENLQLIKGGGACLFQEKLIAASTNKLILVADYRKKSSVLGENWHKGVPIEVVPLAWKYVSEHLQKIGCEKPSLRLGGSAKAGPILTDNGNFIIDADFGQIADPKKLLLKIKSILGVVEVGLFVDMADEVYFGMKDGSTYKRLKNVVKGLSNWSIKR